MAPRGAHAEGPAPVLWMSGAYPGYTSFTTGLRARFDSTPVEVLAPPPDPQTPPPAPGDGTTAPTSGPRARGARARAGAACPACGSRSAAPSCTPGQRVRITGTMFDVNSRALLDGRTVLVYLRGEDGGRWKRTAVLRSDAQGEITLKRTVRRAHRLTCWSTTAAR